VICYVHCNITMFWIRLIEGSNFTNFNFQHQTSTWNKSHMNKYKILATKHKFDLLSLLSFVKFSHSKQSWFVFCLSWFFLCCVCVRHVECWSLGMVASGSKWVLEIQLVIRNAIFLLLVIVSNLNFKNFFYIAPHLLI
jgi:hypothetical protein